MRAMSGKALAAGLAGLMMTAPWAQAQTPATSGQSLYNADCAMCHTTTGAGGLHFGDAVSADLRAPGLETLYHGKDTLILRAILQAKDQDGAPLDLPMPAWQGRLTKAQASDILAYLKTLRS